VFVFGVHVVAHNHRYRFMKWHSPALPWLKGHFIGGQYSPVSSTVGSRRSATAVPTISIDITAVKATIFPSNHSIHNRYHGSFSMALFPSLLVKDSPGSCQTTRQTFILGMMAAGTALLKSWWGRCVSSPPACKGVTKRMSDRFVMCPYEVLTPAFNPIGRRTDLVPG